MRIEIVFHTHQNPLIYADIKISIVKQQQQRNTYRWYAKMRNHTYKCDKKNYKLSFH